MTSNIAESFKFIQVKGHKFKVSNTLYKYESNFTPLLQV